MINRLYRSHAMRLVYRLREYYIALRTNDRKQYPELETIAPDGLPLPTPLMMTRVLGTAHARWFYESGLTSKRAIEEALGCNNLALSNFERVLDFGCGCGRTIRHMQDTPHTQFYGTDYDTNAIQWCQANLPFAHFETNQLQPPTRYADHTFDMIYAFSVFTHLSSDGQLLWRDELKRITKPGGYLLLSFQGRKHLSQHRLGDADALSRFDRGELVVIFEQTAGMNLCGAYHPEQFVCTTFADGLEVVDIIPDGARGNFQDLYIFRVPIHGHERPANDIASV